MMDTSSTDLAFLQHLYEKDTLYLVPERSGLANQPIPDSAKVIEQPLSKSEEGVSIPVENDGNSHILATKESVPEPAPTPPEDIDWLGQAIKGTYLLFAVGAEEYNLLPQHSFLSKILAAVGLQTLEVKFGNLSTSKSHNIKDIALAQKARHILVFGDNLPIENLAKLEPYRMYKLEETRFVRVHALADIEKSKELKGKLWDVLQKIFLQ